MNENQTIISIGPLMKAARKFKKYNQADVANAIGCSQSALSKMEHNLLIPSAPQWFLFARFTAIPPETLERGFIDRHSRVKFNSDEVSLGFKIPKKYRSFRSEKVREIYPFLQYLEKMTTRDRYKEFILLMGIDEEFFLDFDNLVNFQLLLDTIDYFIRLGKYKQADIEEIVRLGQNDVYWNHYGVEWKKLPNVTSVLEEFAKEQVFFQTDFQLKLETQTNRLTLSYYPEYHLKQLASTVSSESIRFLNYYRKATIEHLIERVLGKKISIDLLPEVSTSPLGARFEVRAA